MNDTPRRHAVIVGLFVSVGLTILAGGAMTIGGITDAFASTVHVSAVFDDVGGLQKGDNVWFSGVPIGTVADVRFDGAAKVEVELAIEEDASAFIHADSLAKIGADGLIGSPIVVLYDGSPGAPAIEDGDVLTAAATVSTGDMLAVLQENNANLLVVTEQLRTLANGIAAGEGTVGQLLTDDGLYADLRSTMATLQAASANAEAMTASLSTFADKMNAPGSLPNQLVTDRETYASLTATVEELEAMAKDASAVVAALEEESRNPDTPLGTLLYDEDAGGDLKATLSNLETGSARLSENMEALQHNFLLRGAFRKLEKEREEAAKVAAERPSS